MADLQSNKLTLTKIINGTVGKGISNIVEQYAINNNSTNPPAESSQDWSNSYVPPTAINRYLWNREVITYTDSTSTNTTPHVAAMYAEDGGEGRGISGISNKYAISNDGTTAPTSGWQDNPMSPTSSAKYLWNKEIVTYTKGSPATTETVRVIGTYSADGAPGSNGYNQATIYLYARQASAPAAPSSSLTYTFSSGALSSIPSPWSQTFPQNNGYPCYMAVAVAISNTSTDIIDSNDWVVQKLVENGINGQNGRGISSTAISYQISNDGTYDPSGTWSSTIPQSIDQGKWLITRTIIIYTDNTNSTSYTKAYIGEDGSQGQPGTDGNGIASTSILYAVTNDNVQPASGSSSWQGTLPSFGEGKWLWIKTIITYDNGNSDESVSKSYTGTDGQDGISITVTNTSYNPTTKITTVTMSDGSSFQIKDGEDGENGSPGAPGTDGTPSYTHFAWANSSDGTVDFSTTVSTNKLYIGVYADSTQQDSSQPSDYNWTLIKGADGEDGDDGYNQATIFLYQRSDSVLNAPTGLTYTFSTGQITGNLGSWSRTIPSGTSPCYVTSAVVISRVDSGNTLTFVTPTVLVENGQPGASGSNYATVYLYKRFSSTPTSSDKPTGNVTYTFSSGQVSGSLNGWTRTIPSGSDPCYVILAQATASAGTTTDTIAKTEWSTPAEVFKNGSNGSPGTNGYNQATIYLYKRSATPLTNSDEPTGLVYKFSDGSLTGSLNGWTRSIPDSPRNPCYVISTALVSQSDEITITDWADPSELVADGINGTSVTVVSTEYQEGISYNTTPSGTWSSTPVQVAQGNYLWTKVTYSDGSIAYSVSRQGEDGKTGKSGTDANQYTIHTNAQEILKFIITQPTSGKYEFSLDDLRINAYNIKDQIAISNAQIVDQVCKYANLDISIINYKLKETIKSSAYSRYIEKKQNDDIFFYFHLGVLYQDLFNDTLRNNLNTSFTEVEKTDIIKNIQEFFNNDLASVDIVVYGQVIEQDFVKVDIDSATFAEDKTLFYTKVVQSNVSIYTQCTSQSTFNPNIDYYAQKIIENNIEKYISIKNGLSSEMLDFSVNAGSLNSAIQNTKLKFNENGLTITNGGIKIYTDNEAEGQEVFRIETGDGEKHLYLNGSGVFTGTIYAQSGEFTGTVHAQNGEFNGTINAGSGSIGGFTIDNDSIYAGNDKQNSPLLLQSSNGSLINVDNIQIGTGAKIKDYLQLGNLKLQNPELYSNVMELKVANQDYFILTNDGNILGKNWSITKDENGFVTANFGNIIAQDGIFTGEVTASVINATTLNSVNFVTENVRAMGGAFIFKPTFKITSITPRGSNIVDFILELNENDKNYFNLDLTNEYIISISGKDTHIGKINSIDLSTNKVSVYLKNADYSIFVTNGTIANYQTLTLFGQAAVDALIGINSDDNWTGDIMPPRALIMEEFTALTETSSGFGDIDYTPKLLLGNLAPLRQYNISGLENITGYGLYADNVFLRGSLTTSGGNSYNYAGVNTQGPIPFNYNSWNTNGATTTPSSQYSDDKIIFWGGAAGVQSNQIQVSPFIVTDKGNIFARSGEFKGSVISDSLITNTIIKAPVIYGNNNQREGHEGEPSLKIYNTDTSTGGIGFYKQVGQVDEERSGVDQDDILTLSISTNGFAHFNNEFISFNENNGNIIFTGTKYIVNNTELRDKELINEASGIYFNQTGDSKLKLDYNSSRGIEITKDQIINYGGYTVNEGIVEIKTIVQSNTIKTLKYYVNSENYYCLMVS